MVFKHKPSSSSRSRKESSTILLLRKLPHRLWKVLTTTMISMRSSRTISSEANFKLPAYKKLKLNNLSSINNLPLNQSLRKKLIAQLRMLLWLRAICCQKYQKLHRASQYYQSQINSLPKLVQNHPTHTSYPRPNSNPTQAILMQKVWDRDQVPILKQWMWQRIWSSVKKNAWDSTRETVGDANVKLKKSNISRSRNKKSKSKSRRKCVNWTKSRLVMPEWGKCLSSRKSDFRGNESLRFKI